jgi:hypothetical protein
MLEMKLVLSMLYKNFDVERVGRAGEVREHFAFTMAPTGLEVRLRRRSMDGEREGHLTSSTVPIRRSMLANGETSPKTEERRKFRFGSDAVEKRFA